MNRTIEQWRQAALIDPLKAARDFLARIAALPSDVRRAVIAWTPSVEILADAWANAAGKDAPLAGAPYALKDLFDVAGAPTRAGSDFLEKVRPTPTEDALIAQRLEALGAVMACKTGLVEFAYGLSGENMWYGDAPHPRLPGALAGGSSSGSAWAVGAGLTPFAIGTDTAGSMRVPATYCGLYAWRDAPGPLTEQGCFPLAKSFDTVGWFSQTPGLLLSLNEALLDNAPAVDNPRVLDLSDICPTLAPELRAASNRVLSEFDAASDQDALKLAKSAFAGSAVAYNVLGSREAYALHAPWLDDYRPRYDPAVWARIDRGRQWSDSQIADAYAKEAQVNQCLANLFQRYDAIALPITPIPSPGKREMTEDYRAELLALTTPASLGRTPALTIPTLLADGASGGIQLLIRRNRRLPIARSLLSNL